jgi:hypothetical protein
MLWVLEYSSTNPSTDSELPIKRVDAIPIFIALNP